MRSKTIQFVENVNADLCDLELGNDFIDMKPKAEQQKNKIDKLDHIKKSFNMCFRLYCQESIKLTHKRKENICQSYI